MRALAVADSTTINATELFAALQGEGASAAAVRRHVTALAELARDRPLQLRKNGNQRLPRLQLRCCDTVRWWVGPYPPSLRW
jgi:hypothetical protein